MTARFGNLGTQYFTDDNVVLGGGSVTFYDPGTTTLKNTYSDSSMSILNTNPVLLDAAGRLPNVFFSGLAKAVLKDSEGEIIQTRDPVGDFSAGDTSFTTWSADVSYSANDVVAGSDGYFYVSQVNSNIANDPTTSPTEWKLLVEQLGFDGTVNGNVYVVDTSNDQGIGNVPVTSIRTLVPLSTVSASAVATVDFTGISATYDEYEIHILRCIPDTDTTNLLFRTSSDNGSTYDSGASDYRAGTTTGNTQAGTMSFHQNLGTTSILLAGGTPNIGASANESGVTMTVRIVSPAAASYTEIEYSGSYVNVDGYYANVIGGGARNQAAAVNAVRLFFNSGNIASGIFTLYGVRRT
jgi:hypothetical protein